MREERVVLIISLIILGILDAIAIFDCLSTNRDTTLRLIWILVIILFPVLGMLVYFLFGFSTDRQAVQ
jgi:hypothetical protein